MAVETVVLSRPAAARCWCGSRPRAYATPTCTSPTALLGDGRWPMVLGHEGAGVVEAVGEGVVELVARRPRRVLLRAGVRQLPACRSGRRTLCETAGASRLAGTLLDGTSRLRALDGTVLQHGLMVACFAELRGRAGAGAVPLPRRSRCGRRRCWAAAW